MEGDWPTADCRVATTASEMIGTGSPIGSVATDTGSPIGQWGLVRGGASPHIRPPLLPLAAPGSEKPPVPQGDPGIGFAVSARSTAPTLRLVVVAPHRFSLPLEEVLPPF